MNIYTDTKSDTNYTSIVTTSTGDVRGFVDNSKGQLCFFGIPYAESPIGNLRFKPTVTKKPWSGVLNATAFSPAGPQVFDPTEGSYEEFTGLSQAPDDAAWIGSEDNLTLNIWTRSTENRNRPVMVWIHGGANWLESSRLHTYHGDNFVSKEDVVYVSLNYRLGIFGWLDVSPLGGTEYEGSHSNGMRDQLCALQWIRENIALFGGDPDNITVMGESAGSIDISWLLVNGKLDGIAKRVVMMSGVGGLLGLSGDLNYGFSEEYAKELGVGFIEKLGIQDFKTLQNASTKEIMTKVSEVAASEDMLFYMDSLFWPRVTKDFCPIDPLRGAAEYGSHGIDVVIGYTAYEMGLWLFWDEDLDQQPFSWSANKLLYPQEFSVNQAQEMYAHAFPEDTEGQHGMNMIGDSIFVMPSYWFADKLAENGENVWMYQFDWQANSRQKALHAADQAFAFGKLETQAASHLLGKPANEQDVKDREALSDFMMGTFLSFAINGNPQLKDQVAPEWKKYTSSERNVFSFDYNSQLKQDPTSARRTWWYDKIYLLAL